MSKRVRIITVLAIAVIVSACAGRPQAEQGRQPATAPTPKVVIN